MKILAIETSCDETAISILEIKSRDKRPVFNILSNVISSQVKVHAEWGGVVPGLAKREHEKNLPRVLKRALKKAEIVNPEKEIDFISVTQGPGLEPALWTGINFAKKLSVVWDIPLIPVNHMLGHLLAFFLKDEEFEIPKIEFPAIALLVSGGHTQIILIKTPPSGASWGKYKLIGETRDDAAGEAFDKVAKMMDLGYPGGPMISKLASSVGSSASHRIVLPRPMIDDYSKDGEFDFSFSGLKTAVLYKLKDPEIRNYERTYGRKYVKEIISKEFQQAVIDVLISKTLRASEKYKAKNIILGGGVTANKELRKQFRRQLSVTSPQTTLLMPKIKFTGDNAAMIALAGYFSKDKIKRPAKSQALKAEGNLTL